MRKKISKFPILLLGVTSFFVFASSVFAGIRIDQPKVRLTIAAGSYAGGEIKVENNGEEETTVKVYLEDWVYSEQAGGKQFLPKGTLANSCSNWITFFPADFTIKPNGVQMVRYTVSVPAETQGGYYSVMFFETGGGAMEGVNEEGNTVLIQILNRLGALFYVEPEGTIKKKIEITKVDINQKLNDLIVAADLINSGNVNITLKGTFNVMDNAGYVVSRGAFDEAYTLPGDKAQLNGTASAGSLKAGSYDMVITLEYENGGSLVKEVLFDVSPDGATSGLTLKD